MKTRAGSRPDVEDLLKPLKGFQRKSVDYVFDRMYLEGPTLPVLNELSLVAKRGLS